MTKSEIMPRTKLDQALIERIKTVLGDDNGDIFAWLWAEYFHLQRCFNDLKNGFGGKNPPMIAVWAVDQKFQNQYRNLLVEAIVLSACRLTDKPTIGGRKTISIRATDRRASRPLADPAARQHLSVLPSWFAHEPNLKKEMERLIKSATNANEALRTWRNRQLAHTDDERERTPVSGDETEAAVNAIHDALAFVWRQLFNEDPELPHQRPTSAALGEHLSRMQKRMARFEAWVLKAAGHDTQDDIHGAAAAVRCLVVGPKAEVAEPGDESDPVVEFLEGAREARKIADRTARQRMTLSAV